MHKLENPGNAPQAFALMQFQSAGDSPAISLLTDEVKRRPDNPQHQGPWPVDATRRRQTVSYMNEDGAQSLSGIVPEVDAVEITGAFKVVVAVALESSLKPAGEKGGISRSYTAIELVQVVEVWATASKCVYRHGAATSGAKVVELKPVSAADFAAGRK